jgi:NAD(P)-dependent dehydrogenase (short-subunit alcohol dehydrogenase family)
MASFCYRIRVNTLAPGAIETDFAGGLVRDNPHINAQLATHTALGRVGLPEDIGAMAAVLLSDEAGWMTAQRVEASGGMFAAGVKGSMASVSSPAPAWCQGIGRHHSEPCARSR